MPLHMEPGQIYNTWAEFKDALDAHCKENKVVFNISNAKTVGQANSMLKRKPYFDIRLKYASCFLVCKHFGSYKSHSSGVRPKQRSYKIDCKAYISVSACRKENYLIIRDSYHLHSHPCTEEIYQSYPEIRRMTNEERKMVGTLMELGVPTSQIKTAVGRNVTPKDLQNAKTHIKAVKLGLKSDEPTPSPRHRKTYKQIQEARRAAGEIVSDTDEDRRENDDLSSSSSQNMHAEEKIQRSGEGGSGDASSSYTVTVGDIDDHLQVGADTMAMVESQPGEEKSPGSGDTGGLSGLLAAAGLSADSVVLTVNNQSQEEQLEDGDEAVKNSYTVTVSLPDGDVTQTGTNLQDLLKGLPLGKIIAKPSASSTSPVKIKTEDEQPVIADAKNCSKCGGYVSPLDGHSQCLSCLGPEHIHNHSCEHCKAMTPEQFNIRRKKMVALRMKALKELRRKRRHEETHSDEQPDSDSDFLQSPRKSKRARKPKDYGPDIAVENNFVMGGVSKSLRRTSLKTDIGDGGKGFLGHLVKKEPLDDYDSSYSNDDLYDDKMDKILGMSSRNTQRFDHILAQTTVFDDVSLTECSNGSLCFAPEADTLMEFKKKLLHKSQLPAVPPTLIGKYNLQPQFESTFCSDPPPLRGINDPSVEAMGTGLCKLATNAAVQTRMAVYDKLFTRLGVGMADEALSILSELYGKVTEVTEISQEDLTNSLQTALDTIQALKDVLEELGVMSKEAITTAAHQRSISINSLKAASKSLKKHHVSVDESTPRRGKFLPFSRTKLSPVASSIQSSIIATSAPVVTSPPYDLKQLVTTIPSSHTEAALSEVPIMAIATSQDGSEVTQDTSTTFINMTGKDFTVAPLAVTGELLQSLSTNKDGIIELHVMKDGSELLDTEEGTVEEVIHTE